MYIHYIILIDVIEKGFKYNCLVCEALLEHAVPNIIKLYDTVSNDTVNTSQSLCAFAYLP